MRKHLYGTKKICPATQNKIELSDEIKQDILENRVHLVKKVEPQTINNNILNIINGIDAVEKINHFIQYSGQKILGYGDHIEQLNQKRIEKMENDTYKYGFKLEESDFLEMIDKSIQVDPARNQQMNLLFVEELNKITMYHDDEWESYLMDAGIKRIITILRDYYLETYEKYVINKIYGINSLDAYNRNNYKVQLNQLYRFYAYFDVEPYAKNKENGELISDFSHSDDNFLRDYCMDQYNQLIKEIGKVEKNNAKKQIIGIIKKNTQVNIKNLNKSILKLANVNEEFKTHILSID
jgi:hypothetical protein